MKRFLAMNKPPRALSIFLLIFPMGCSEGGSEGGHVEVGGARYEWLQPQLDYAKGEVVPFGFRFEGEDTGRPVRYRAEFFVDSNKNLKLDEGESSVVWTRPWATTAKPVQTHVGSRKPFKLDRSKTYGFTVEVQTVKGAKIRQSASSDALPADRKIGAGDR